MGSAKRYCKCGCKHVLPAGRDGAEFISAACRKRYERAKYKEADPGLAADVLQVAQQTRAGSLPPDYLTAIRSLQELRRDVEEIPAMVTQLIEGLAGLALAHGLKEGEVAELAAADHKLAGLFCQRLLSVGNQLREYGQAGAEAYAEGHLGEAIAELLYPAQVGFSWQAGDELPDDDGDGYDEVEA